MLTLKQVTVPVGGEINPTFTGDYLRVHGSSVAVKFRTENNDDFSLVQGQEARLAPFKKLLISHDDAAVQTITLYIGSNGSDASSAEIAGSVTVTNLPAVQDVEVTNFPVEYFSYGASYKSVTGLAANTAQAVFLPAANVNGAVIHDLSFISGNNSGGAGAGVGFVAKTSTPATFIDGDVILSPDNAGVLASNFLYGGRLQRPVFIPAGKGLYFISTLAEIYVSRSALYSLL